MSSVRYKKVKSPPHDMLFNSYGWVSILKEFDEENVLKI